MAKTTANIKMEQQLSRKLIPLATGMALLIAFLAPVTFWILGHNSLLHMTSLYAESLSEQFQQITKESPALWKYQTYKFAAIAKEFHPAIDVISYRILDEKEGVISEHTYKNGGEKLGRSLTFWEELRFSLVTAPIHFNNRQVGTTEVIVDDTRLLQLSVIFFFFSSLGGTALALICYRFPVRVVKKMSWEIDELITNVKKSEEEVRKLNAGLELKIEERTRQLLDAQEDLVRKEKLSILGQLSGSVGHELRNPLGVMSNAIYFLKMVLTEADETTKEYLDIIKQEIENSQRIITDLLDFARTKTPQTKMVTARQLLDDSICKCVIPENVELKTVLPDTLPLLMVDPLQMVQVLQNFITNAVQAMPDGGSVQVSARCGDDTGAENFIEISIADTGEGISPGNMEKLFQPLFTTKAKGIGLGLVVCRNLTEANGGRIEVESRAGTGTTFSLILPAER